MMKNSLRKTLPLLVAIGCLAAPLLACSLYLGGPGAPYPQVTPAGSARDIEQAWADAVALSGDGTVTVVFQEAQLTAYLREKLEASPGNTLHDVQVFLRDGRIHVYGILETGSVTASVLISLRPEVTEQGGVNLVVEQAQLGPLDLPGELLGAVSGMLTGAFTGQVGTLATGFLIQEILVGDGMIALRGVLR
jgi:hypothetical protein